VSKTLDNMHFTREYMPKLDFFEGKSGEKQRRTSTFITLERATW